MTIEQIAEVCHDINRAYCIAIGDDPEKVWKWKDAPDWQKNSCMNGVQLHLNNPKLTPQNSHENWLAVKIMADWKYGEVKDQEKKTHPCIVPYKDLPADQKAKDHIFRQIVHSLSRYYDPSSFECFNRAFNNQDNFTISDSLEDFTRKQEEG